MKTWFANISRISTLAIILALMCWGCAGVEQKFDDWQSAMREKLNFGSAEEGGTVRKDGDETYYIHTSKWSWETLDCVAEWYTGDPQNAKKLAEINPSVNADKIATGSEVAIPVKLLRTREPLPKNFSLEYRANYYKHTVRWPGESLSLIASWYTGASKNWRKMAAANPRLNPNQIKGGDVILIPPAMLKTRVPLPQKVAAKYTSDYFAYRVKADNEKLEDISRWYTGDAANRDLLAKANPDLNPDHLKIGDEVYVPNNVLKPSRENTTAQPSVPPLQPAVKPPASEPKTAKAEDGNLKLFGPKQFPKQ